MGNESNRRKGRTRGVWSARGATKQGRAMGAWVVAVGAITGSSAMAQQTEVLIGSRGWGSIYAPLSNTSVPRDLVTGMDLLTGFDRGSGPWMACPGGHLSLLGHPPGHVLVRAGEWTEYGLYRVDRATGDRELLPGTNTPMWASTSEMLLWDSGTVLIVADDFVGGQSSGASVDDAKVLRYELATGVTTVVSSSTVGDGVVMHRPRGIVRLDPESILVVEVGPISLNGAVGSLLYRINVTTGNRTVISSLGETNSMATERRVRTGGVVTPAPVVIAAAGSGPGFEASVRGLAIVGGRILVCGATQAGGAYEGGIVEVDSLTGNRTLLAGAARAASGGRVQADLALGSTPMPTSPTSLQEYTTRSVVLCSTFGPNRIWEYDLIDHRLQTLVDMDSRVDPALQSSTLFSGLAVLAPLDCSQSTLEITENPLSAVTCTDRTAMWHAAAAGTGPITYQWQVSCPVGSAWVDISEGYNQIASGCTFFATGAELSDLLVAFTSFETPAGEFRCIVRNACHERISTVAGVEHCEVDYNCSGLVSVQDLFDFLEGFFAGDPRADFNQSSGITVQDLFDFIAAFFAGCP